MTGQVCVVLPFVFFQGCIDTRRISTSSTGLLHRLDLSLNKLSNFWLLWLSSFVWLSYIHLLATGICCDLSKFSPIFQVQSGLKFLHLVSWHLVVMLTGWDWQGSKNAWRESEDDGGGFLPWCYHPSSLCIPTSWASGMWQYHPSSILPGQ